MINYEVTYNITSSMKIKGINPIDAEEQAKEAIEDEIVIAGFPIEYKVNIEEVKEVI